MERDPGEIQGKFLIESAFPNGSVASVHTKRFRIGLILKRVVLSTLPQVTTVAYVS